MLKNFNGTKTESKDSTNLMFLKEQRIWKPAVQTVQADGSSSVVPLKGNESAAADGWNGSWCTFNEAEALEEKFPNGVGIGFKLPEGYFVLRIKDKEIDDPFVKTLLSRHETYSEYAENGKDIQIFGKCNIAKIPTFISEKGKRHLDRRYYLRNPNNNVDLYFGDLSSCFVVYTGKVIEDKPLQDCTDTILTTLEKDMSKQEKTNYSENRDGSRADFDLVQALKNQKNGDKFWRLFDRGDFSNYSSHSKADVALCAMIAFRTGPDAEKIDRIFRLSALFYGKWNEKEYREQTINEAINTCDGNFYRYNPVAQLHNDIPMFIRTTKKGEPYVHAALLGEYVRNNFHYFIVKDGTHARRHIYVYDGGYYRTYDDEMFKAIFKQVVEDYDIELLKMSVIQETFNDLMATQNYLTQADLNQDESIINFTNGVLKISESNLQLLPHNPIYKSTIQIPCEWKGVPSPTPVFDNYLETLTNGDKQVQQLLLEFIGACISNVKGSRMKKAMFLFGDGNTGKSRYIELVQNLLGHENYCNLDLHQLETRFGPAALYGKRFGGNADISLEPVRELKTFKMATGGDYIEAEFKGADLFSFKYNGLLCFSGNKLPRFGGDNGKWVYDRILPVECLNELPINKQDKKLLENMYAEREGIVYKAILALRTVIANGYNFTEPASVIATRRSYKHENSSAITFFKECMNNRNHNRIDKKFTTGIVFKVYRKWCKDNEYYSISYNDFKKEICQYLHVSNYGDLITRLNGNSYFKDYELSPDIANMYWRETDGKSL